MKVSVGRKVKGKNLVRFLDFKQTLYKRQQNIKHPYGYLFCNNNFNFYSLEIVSVFDTQYVDSGIVPK